MTLSSATDSIAAHRQTFADALAAGDATAATSVYAEGAHLFAPATGPVVGRAEICAYWQAGIDAGVAEVALTATDSQQSDGLAYEMGGYVIRVEPPDGVRVLERGHYVQVYQRHADGSWRRAVEIFSPGGSE